MSAIVLSLVTHLALFTALVVATAIWQAEQSKVYIVNLVPTVAAVGSPTGHARATPQAPAKSEPALRATPAAQTPPAETPASPTLPEPPREPARAPSAREAPALPEAAAAHAIALPPARSRPTVPSLPNERPVLGLRNLEPTLPARLDLPRERPARPIRLAPTGDVPARPMPRDVREVARSLTPPTPLPPPLAPPDMARASTPPLPRPATLPRAGKELPNFAAAPPEPAALAPARPTPAALTTASRLVPPPPGAVALGQPAGSTQGSGPVTVQASDFPFAWYLRAVQRKITEKWAPPAHGDGRAVIGFEISRNGEVKNAAVEGSSGDAVYDQAALRAIGDATPFPPLPEQYKSSILKIHLGFSPVSDRG